MALSFWKTDSKNALPVQNIDQILAYDAGSPINVVNPEVLD